jgi:hypothetical protein
VNAVNVDGSVVLAGVTAVVAWTLAASVNRRSGGRGVGGALAALVAIAPVVLLWQPARDGYWRGAQEVGRIEPADLILAAGYALGIVVVIALAGVVLALVLGAAWVLQEATVRLIELYRKLFPKKPTPAEIRAARRRALFDTAIPQLRSSTYVVSTSPLDPTGSSTPPAVPSIGINGPVWAPPPPRRFTDGLDTSVLDLTAGSHR